MGTDSFLIFISSDPLQIYRGTRTECGTPLFFFYILVLNRKIAINSLSHWPSPLKFPLLFFHEKWS
jgi:hypothetical protein